MAAMAEGGDKAARLPMPSRNPLPLSASQESQVKDIFYARVRDRCADEIKGVSWSCHCHCHSHSQPRSCHSCSSPSFHHHPLSSLFSIAQLTNTHPPGNPAFADCALGRTFSAPFACRAPHRVMNNCMMVHATPAEQDGAREEWFAQRLERQRERERKAHRKAEQEAFLREWWGLPEKDLSLIHI